MEAEKVWGDELKNVCSSYDSGSGGDDDGDDDDDDDGDDDGEIHAYSNSNLVVAIDINGNRDLEAVEACLDRVLNWWKPRLVIVKSRSLYRKLVDLGI